MGITEQMKTLVAEISKPDVTDYERVVGAVKEAATALSTAVNIPGLSVSLETGFLVNMGQQYRFIVSVGSAGYKDTFFRLYVPPDGFPTTLQLFEGETRVCHSIDDLRREIMDFLNRDAIKQRLRALMSMAKEVPG